MDTSLNPDAILFDMDGVLVDSFNSWWKSLNKIAKTAQNKTISKEEFRKYYWGHTLQENLKELGINIRNQPFCTKFYQDYIDEIIVFPQTKTTLQQLKGYQKAIITNTPNTCTEEILTRANLHKYFKTIITSDQVERGKPSPDIVYKACELLKVNSEAAVLIGDTENDIKAGRSAGCTTIGIKTEGDYQINHIGELLNIITIKK